MHLVLVEDVGVVDVVLDGIRDGVVPSHWLELELGLAASLYPLVLDLLLDFLPEHLLLVLLLQRPVLLQLQLPAPVLLQFLHLSGALFYCLQLLLLV